MENSQPHPGLGTLPCLSPHWFLGLEILRTFSLVLLAAVTTIHLLGTRSGGKLGDDDQRKAPPDLWCQHHQAGLSVPAQSWDAGSHGGDPREKASTHLSKFLLGGRNKTQEEASAQRTLQGILRVSKISSGYHSTQRWY